MNDDEYKNDIKTTKKGKNQTDCEKNSLKNIEISQLKNFKEYLQTANERGCFQLEGPLVLHQPRNFGFLIGYNQNTNDNQFQVQLPRTEPFYLSNSNFNDFIPTYFENSQCIQEYVEYGINNDIIVFPNSSSRTHRTSPLDQILLENVVGTITQDENNNNFFSIEQFKLSPHSTPITIDLYRSPLHKYTYH